MNRETIARLHIVNDLIDEKEDQLARLRIKATDPAGGSIILRKDKTKRNTREDRLIDYLDRTEALERDIDRLRAEQAALHDEIRQELAGVKDYYTRKLAEWRLIKRYTWTDCSELSGYNARYCQMKLDKWINTFN